MSLIKQLWIAIILVMSLTFAGSFAVSTLAAKNYLQQQLQLKNMDNAASLALSMSQMNKDPITIELLLAAQFDTGHYQRISLIDPNGEIIVERTHQGDGDYGAPDWFVNLIPLAATPGAAQVQERWRQYGTLEVESHSSFAYRALWQGTLQLLQWFLLVAVIGGLGGTWILKTITRPLDVVVAQAEAMGNRRFITANEPRTLEFRTLTRAMNTLTERVRAMLEKEARQLDEYRRQNQLDKVTGLSNREHFLNELDSVLSSSDYADTGALILARIIDLAEINQRLGHMATDRLLTGIGQALQTTSAEHPQAISGRVKNTDFALLLPALEPIHSTAEAIAQRLYAVLDQHSPDSSIRLALAAATYHHAEHRASLLARVDGALAQAEQQDERGIEVLTDITPPLFTNLEDWRRAISQALAEEGVRLGSFPVIRCDGPLLHYETPVRLKLGGQEQTAGFFIRWANRLNLTPSIDLAVAQAALQLIATHPQPIGINLSGEALRDAWFRSELFTLLQNHPTETRHLWIELTETDALQHLNEFKSLCLALHPLGCHMGLEHVGNGFARISELHDLGLDYIKIDSALIRDIDHNNANQTFIRGLCTIAHSIGLLAIAEGVRSDGEMLCLPELGVDGMTGPGVRMP